MRKKLKVGWLLGGAYKVVPYLCSLSVGEYGEHGKWAGPQWNEVDGAGDVVGGGVGGSKVHVTFRGSDGGARPNRRSRSNWAKRRYSHRRPSLSPLTKLSHSHPSRSVQASPSDSDLKYAEN